MGLEPLEVKEVGFKSNVKCVGFHHVLNLIAGPLVTYLGGLAAGQNPPWSDALATHFSSVMAIVEKEVPHATGPMAMDAWASSIRKSIHTIAKVDVSMRHIKEVLARVVPVGMDSRIDMARGTGKLLLLASPVMAKLIGPSLAQHVKRATLVASPRYRPHAPAICSWAKWSGRTSWTPWSGSTRQKRRNELRKPL